MRHTANRTSQIESVRRVDTFLRRSIYILDFEKYLILRNGKLSFYKKAVHKSRFMYILLNFM